MAARPILRWYLECTLLAAMINVEEEIAKLEQRSETFSI